MVKKAKRSISYCKKHKSSLGILSLPQQYSKHSRGYALPKFQNKKTTGFLENKSQRFLNKKAQMEIQQMSFMIVAVFIFFMLVGIFFLRVQMGSLSTKARDLQRAEAISSVEVIANMPELNYDSSETLVLDEDKLRIMASGLSEIYERFWPVSSIEVYKIYPKFDEPIKCPASNCNYYQVYDNKQKNTEKHSSFVSICQKTEEYGSIYDRCTMGKLVVGVKINE